MAEREAEAIGVSAEAIGVSMAALQRKRPLKKVCAREECCKTREELELKNRQVAAMTVATIAMRKTLQSLTPHLVDDERERAKAVWDGAFTAHSEAKQGELGPWSIVALALRAAEKRGSDVAALHVRHDLASLGADEEDEEDEPGSPRVFVDGEDVGSVACLFAAFLKAAPWEEDEYPEEDEARR